jgi:hypothetical protein
MLPELEQNTYKLKEIKFFRALLNLFLNANSYLTNDVNKNFKNSLKLFREPNFPQSRLLIIPIAKYLIKFAKFYGMGLTGAWAVGRGL